MNFYKVTSVNALQIFLRRKTARKLNQPLKRGKTKKYYNSYEAQESSNLWR